MYKIQTYNKFDGYDYCELLEAWNISIPSYKHFIDYPNIFVDIEFIYLSEFILNFIFPKLFDNGVQSKFTKRAVKDIRLFLKELSRCNLGYFSKVWRTISEIEDDFSLVQFLISESLGHAWC